MKCPDCGKPVGNDHPHAKVYHMSCCMDKLAEAREKQKDNPKYAKSTAHQD